MKKPLLKSLVLHIGLLLFCTLPILVAVDKEIIPIKPVPVIFKKDTKTTVKKTVPKLNKKKPVSKPKVAKKSPPKPKVSVPKKTASKKVVKKDKKFDNLINEIAKTEDSFDKILKDLTPEREKPEIIDEPEPSISTSIQDKQNQAMLEDILRQQIMENWLVPIGVKDIHKMAVDIQIEVGQEGKVLSTKILRNQYYQNNDTAYDNFVQTALRAILKSSPLKYTKDEYLSNTKVIFHFEPSHMF